MRNPTLGAAPYVGARDVDQIIPLTHEGNDRRHAGADSLRVEVPAHRLEFRAGKLSTADMFDLNRAGTDSHCSS